MLPPKRKSPKSGIARGPKREWQRHRKFVRSHGCSVRDCLDGPIEFAHIRTAANAGIALRPHDAFAVSLCSSHHREQHQIGHASFERKYGLDLKAMAAEFVRKSPDTEMRESLKLVSPKDL